MNFDQSYDPINGLTYQATSSRYTVQAGDTLQSVALSLWGDSAFWYRFYLYDNKCSDRYVALRFPVGSTDSGIVELADAWRPRKDGDPNPALGKRVYCLCTGKIHYEHSAKDWSPVMHIESVERVWFVAPSEDPN